MLLFKETNFATLRLERKREVALDREDSRMPVTYTRLLICGEKLCFPTNSFSSGVGFDGH